MGGSIRGNGIHLSGRDASFNMHLSRLCDGEESPAMTAPTRFMSLALSADVREFLALSAPQRELIIRLMEEPDYVKSVVVALYQHNNNKVMGIRALREHLPLRLLHAKVVVESIQRIFGPFIQSEEGE